jgi:hypothetical protein
MQFEPHPAIFLRAGATALLAEAGTAIGLIANNSVDLNVKTPLGLLLARGIFLPSDVYWTIAQMA